MQIIRIFLLSTITILLIDYGCSKTIADETLQSFWVRFHQAVMEGDKNKVASMTRFPFEVRGPADFNPVIKKSRDDFVETIYDNIMMQMEGRLIAGRYARKTQRELIQEKLQIDPGEQQGKDFAHIFSLDFRKVKGKWLLTRAYLDDYE